MFVEALVNVILQLFQPKKDRLNWNAIPTVPISPNALHVWCYHQRARQQFLEEQLSFEDQQSLTQVAGWIAKKVRICQRCDIIIRRGNEWDHTYSAKKCENFFEHNEYFLTAGVYFPRDELIATIQEYNTIFDAKIEAISNKGNVFNRITNLMKYVQLPWLRAHSQHYLALKKNIVRSFCKMKLHHYIKCKEKRQ